MCTTKERGSTHTHTHRHCGLTLLGTLSLSRWPHSSASCARMGWVVVALRSYHCGRLGSPSTTGEHRCHHSTSSTLRQLLYRPNTESTAEVPSDCEVRVGHAKWQTSADALSCSSDAAAIIKKELTWPMCLSVCVCVCV
jgi:hypothetical protein